MLNSKDSLVTNREECPICKSKTYKVLFYSKHDDNNFFDFIKFEKYLSHAFYDAYHTGVLGELIYQIAECNECHFIYLTEVLNDKGMEQLYNNWLDKELLKEHYSKLKYDTTEETMLKLIKKCFEKKSQLKVMDFGAGYGNFCSIATKLGFNTYAFDLSTDKNDHMNSMGVTIINSFEKYYGYFDFIHVNQVFEHLSDPRGVLQNLQQCLSDEGLIYIAVPNCTDLKEILKEKKLSQKLFKLLSPHQHINAFTNRTLKLLGNYAGLKPLSNIDFLKLFSTSYNFPEIKYWVKNTIKGSMFKTGLFFKKK